MESTETSTLTAIHRLWRSKPGKPRRHRPPAKDADALRRRKAAANRIFNVLKAALNHAWRQGKAPSDDSWRKVERFKRVDAPVIRYLAEVECKRLVNACAPDFRQLVRAALLTGCRYGELTALRCADFNPDAGTLLVRASKSGKSRHVVLTEEAQRFFADEVAGRVGEHTMLRRSSGEQWKSSDQQRPLAVASKNGRISPTITLLRHTHGSMLAMKGVPMAVIAKQLGHADTRMSEKHHAHLSPKLRGGYHPGEFPYVGNH